GAVRPPAAPGPGPAALPAACAILLPGEPTLQPGGHGRTAQRRSGPAPAGGWCRHSVSGSGRFRGTELPAGSYGFLERTGLAASGVRKRARAAVRGPGARPRSQPRPAGPRRCGRPRPGAPVLPADGAGLPPGPALARTAAAGLPPVPPGAASAGRAAAGTTP